MVEVGVSGPEWNSFILIPDGRDERIQGGMAADYFNSVGAASRTRTQALLIYI